MPRLQDSPTLLLNVELASPLLNGFSDAYETLGWRAVNLINTSNYIPSGLSPIGSIISQRPMSSHFLELGFPVVATSHIEEKGFMDLPCVLEDRYAAGCLAADAFAERGFKQIGFPGDASESLLLGFQRQGEKVHDCEVHLHRTDAVSPHKSGTDKYEEHVVAISKWLKDCPMPIGVLAFNYRMAIRIIVACDMIGLSIPEQVAIICRGNHANSAAICKTAPVPLSSIDTNQDERGRQAVWLLKRLIEGETPPRQPILVQPKGIIESRSTDILAATDPRVATAIRFMWDHLDQPLSVDDVAYAVNTSRNTLEKGFRLSLKRGVNAELRRKRMEVCKELLRGTDMTIAAITKAVGLKSRRYLHSAFKKACGMTPKQYRSSLEKGQQSIGDTQIGGGGMQHPGRTGVDGTQES